MANQSKVQGHLESKLVTVLSDLASYRTHENMTAFLVTEGFIGSAGCLHCPVSLFCSDRLGWDVHVGYTFARVFEHPVKERRNRAMIEVALPKIITSFVWRFDVPKIIDLIMPNHPDAVSVHQPDESCLVCVSHVRRALIK